MKILFVVDSFSGGAGNVVQILAHELLLRRYQVTVLLLNGKQVEPKLDLRGAEIIDYPLSLHTRTRTPVGHVFAFTRAVKKQLGQINPDVIISFLNVLNILCCMANGGRRPLIISERNDPSHDRLKPHWALLRRLFYGKADKIIVQCSNFESFCHGKFRSLTTVIPNPIPKPVETQRSRNDGEIRLVSLGRLQRQKNFPWLIEAMTEIHSVEPHAVLKIYGVGEEEQALRRLIREKQAGSYIELMGYTAMPHSVLAQSDIYVMTSDYEGFPNALSEAMAVGLPSVSRECHRGLKDLVEDGVNGCLVPMDDRKAFVNRVLALAKDQSYRNKISIAAQSVADAFSVSQITDLWENEVLSLVHQQ